MTTLAKWTSISFTSHYLGVCSELPPRCHSGGRPLQPQWSGSIVTLRPRSQTDLSELRSRLLKQTASRPPCDPASVNMTDKQWHPKFKDAAQMWRGESDASCTAWLPWPTDAFCGTVTSERLQFCLRNSSPCCPHFHSDTLKNIWMNK